VVFGEPGPEPSRRGPHLAGLHEAIQHALTRVTPAPLGSVCNLHSPLLIKTFRSRISEAIW
jgi:hypothetical protein